MLCRYCSETYRQGKHILAVKYVFEFNLADNIPPVALLKACVDESEKLANRLSEEGKSLVSVCVPLIDNLMRGTTAYIY